MTGLRNKSSSSLVPTNKRSVRAEHNGLAFSHSDRVGEALHARSDTSPRPETPAFHAPTMADSTWYAEGMRLRTALRVVPIQGGRRYWCRRAIDRFRLSGRLSEDAALLRDDLFRILGRDDWTDYVFLIACCELALSPELLVTSLKDLGYTSFVEDDEPQTVQ
jgi:hypothetical protein